MCPASDNTNPYTNVPWKGGMQFLVKKSWLMYDHLLRYIDDVLPPFIHTVDRYTELGRVPKNWLEKYPVHLVFLHYFIPI
jgi:hypothetical protein